MNSEIHSPPSLREAFQSEVPTTQLKSVLKETSGYEVMRSNAAIFLHLITDESFSVVGEPFALRAGRLLRGCSNAKLA
jgi:hypothetical protein